MRFNDNSEVTYFLFGHAVYTNNGDLLCWKLQFVVSCVTG